jgi:hypothetical protein
LQTAMVYLRGKLGMEADTPVALTRLPVAPSRMQQLMDLMQDLQKSATAIPAALQSIQAAIAPQSVQATLPVY